MLKNNEEDYPIHVACKAGIVPFTPHCLPPSPFSPKTPLSQLLFLLGRNEFVLRLVQKNPTLYLSQLLELLPRLDGFRFQPKASNAEDGKKGEEEDNNSGEKESMGKEKGTIPALQATCIG